MQPSIFDLPINSTIADLPTATVEPKSENWYVVADKPTAEPRASPKFAIGEIVQSDRYFKNLNGEIIGFEQFGNVDFAIVRYRWYDSVVDYPAPISSLILVQETHLLDVGLAADNQQPFAENQQFKIGDRVKVLEHQFMRDRIGEIQDLHPNGKQAIVNFGATENIWLISIGSLENV